jgi:hypothetical protein
MLHSVHNRIKGKGQQASSTEVDEVTDKLQREFLLVSALSSTIYGSGTWLVDSGATFHMTGAQELFREIHRV